MDPGGGVGRIGYRKTLKERHNLANKIAKND